MRKAVLPILATLSLLFIVVLLVGCFIRAGRGVVFDSYGRRSVVAAAVALDGGGARLDYSRTAPSTSSSTFSFALDPPKIRMPDAKRLLWEFDAQIGRSSGRGNTFIYVEFPVWVAAMPCLIAPILWLRRRMRTNDSRGFAVIASGRQPQV
jgi:hypothetical protein